MKKKKKIKSKKKKKKKKMSNNNDPSTIIELLSIAFEQKFTLSSFKNQFSNFNNFCNHPKK